MSTLDRIAAACLICLSVTAPFSRADVMALSPDDGPGNPWTLDDIHDGKVVSSTAVESPLAIGVSADNSVLYIASNSGHNVRIAEYGLDKGDHLRDVQINGANIPGPMASPAPWIVALGDRLLVPSTHFSATDFFFELMTVDPLTGQDSRARLGSPDIMLPLNQKWLGITTLSSKTIAIVTPADGKRIGSIPEPDPFTRPFVCGNRVYGSSEEDGVVRPLAEFTGDQYVKPDSPQSLTFTGKLGPVRALLVDGRPMAVVPEVDAATRMIQNVSFCDLTDFKVVRRIALPLQAKSVYPSSDMKQLWFVDGTDGNVKVLDAHTGQVTTQIDTHFPLHSCWRSILVGTDR